MSEKSASANVVLQLRFKLRVSPYVLLAQSQEAAGSIASAEGLIWKIWVFRKQEFEIGGVYLFANREAAEAYLKHPVIQALCSNPAVVSMHSQFWEVERSLSAITHAPLGSIHEQSSEPHALTAGGQ